MRRILVLLLLLGATGTAAWWFTRPVPLPVVLAEVATGRVEASIANTRAGTVEACQRTKLSPITGGRIVYLGVKEGDHVRRGQVLMRLWNEDQLAQSTVSEKQVDTANRHVSEICTLAASAAREAERTTRLHGRGFVSETAEEKARADAESRQAACAAARSEVVQAHAQVHLNKVEQNRTVLIAPFDGIVAEITGELGEYATPSPPGVATPPAIDLIDPTCLYVNAPMDEVDAPKMRVGQNARITLDAFPGQVFPAHVRRVAPYVMAVEKQARTVDVEASFDRREDIHRMLVGYSADVEIVLEHRDNVLRVPTSALLEGGRVLRYQPDSGRLEERKLRTGVANWEYTEVLQGLSAGDRIVLSLEREGVKAGAQVQPEARAADK
ncbi:macrolide export protein MacA [mine drainage metagenome]|uniref:Macrolide export protein MacA n=1 Tax=mine drainage metagenome TaxID=410659 RepID=A0A1J5QH05_9ZZZZ